MATTRYFFQASQEQFPPEDLLQQAIEVEQAGFDGIATSDHLQPWWEGGESGHTWPWLGAAGQATKTILLGTGVTPPGARYHPALIAQAWATLERLFPGRMFLGMGSGEALNEVPVGDDWPSPGEQVDRLEEALSIIDRLWKGETITEQGRFFSLKDCKLHTLSERRPPVWVSAFGPKAAAVAARWGDGLWTLADPESVPDLLGAYRTECDATGRDPGEIVLHTGFSWAQDDDAALEGARVWKGAQPDDLYTDDIHVPREVLAHGEEETSDEDLKEAFIVSSDPEEHVERIREIERLGASIVVLQNNSGADPHRAIEVYGRDVLPALRGARVA
jgi:coenzyme F420-dependent glucose-6-phosphate dehydrogenase